TPAVGKNASAVLSLCPGVHAAPARSTGVWPEESCSAVSDRFLLICLSTPNRSGIWCHASWCCGMAGAELCLDGEKKWLETAYRIVVCYASCVKSDQGVINWYRERLPT